MFQSPIPFSQVLPFIGPLQSQFLGPLQQSQGFGFLGSGNDTVNITSSTPGPQGPPGSPGPEGPPGTPGLVPVTLINVTPYSVLLSDYLLAIDVAAPASVVLPVATVGTQFVIKDTAGDAQTNPITVTALGTTIDGLTSYTLNVNYASVTIVSTGTEWSII